MHLSGYLNSSNFTGKRLGIPLDGWQCELLGANPRNKAMDLNSRGNESDFGTFARRRCKIQIEPKMNYLSRHLFHGAICAMSVFAQNPVFEVASIKPSDPNSPQVRIRISPGGRFVAKGITGRMLIQEAYGVRDFQISGGPSWLGTDRFEINAKGEGDGDIRREQLRPMLQALLADRFKLALKHETKDAPIYALVAGKGGHKLKDGQGPKDRPMMRMGMGHLNVQNGSLEMFANTLSNSVGRLVIDKTELKGSYDFELDWTPEPGQGMGPGGPGGPPPPGHQGPPVNVNGPSIFAAVREQLGLKLESQRGPAPLLVIERIERPSEN